VVDNRTGDPVLVTPARGIQAGERAWLPGAGHVAGRNGSQWRTDVELHNPGAAAARCRIELFPWGREVAEPPSVTVDVPGWRSVRLDDVVLDRFAHTGGASLRLTPEGGVVMASARTYSQGPTGSVGQHVEAIAEGQAVTPAAPRRVIMLRQAPARDRGFRANLGLVNTRALAAVVAVELLDAAGAALGTITVPLRAFESVQIDEVVRRVAPAGADHVTAVVGTATPGAAVLAYACLVDNRSNDPVLIAAQ
jgi:hypothetical protein